MSRVFRLIIILSVIGSFICSTAIIILSGVERTPSSPTRQEEFMGTVHDTPVVQTLDGYYELIRTGYVDLPDGRLWLQDLSLSDRKSLQLMLRTP